MGTEQLPTGEAKHAFTYRVRVTNGRDSTLQVLGRSWTILDATGALGEWPSVREARALPISIPL
jgi:uncharacterized protein affecting Mg2+/Co2+ transport